MPHKGFAALVSCCSVRHSAEKQHLINEYNNLHNYYRYLIKVVFLSDGQVGDRSCLFLLARTRFVFLIAN